MTQVTKNARYDAGKPFKIRFLHDRAYLMNGPGGSRTRVQKPIPCSSTSVVIHLTFPLLHGEAHPYSFSSFMIRTPTQSLTDAVSHRFEPVFLSVSAQKGAGCD